MDSSSSLIERPRIQIAPTNPPLPPEPEIDLAEGLEREMQKFLLAYHRYFAWGPQDLAITSLKVQLRNLAVQLTRAAQEEARHGGLTTRQHNLCISGIVSATNVAGKISAALHAMVNQDKLDYRAVKWFDRLLSLLQETLDEFRRRHAPKRLERLQHN